MPRLTVLDLGHCSHLTDAGVNALASLTTLRALGLRDCVMVTDVGERTTTLTLIRNPNPDLNHSNPQPLA